MTDTPTEDLMDYNTMVERAMRSVVQSALNVAEQQGLPGEHHFYITFRTTHNGVEMPDFLRAKYPESMTIVLQHQFFNLQVTNSGFSVQLSFNKQMCDLVIPFDALQTFADPSVNFGVQFNAVDMFDEDSFLEDELIDFEMALSNETEDPKKSPKGDDGEKVISLDSFRKKGD